MTANDSNYKPHSYFVESGNYFKDQPLPEELKLYINNSSKRTNTYNIKKTKKGITSPPLQTTEIILNPNKLFPILISIDRYPTAYLACISTDNLNKPLYCTKNDIIILSYNFESKKIKKLFTTEANCLDIKNGKILLLKARDSINLMCIDIKTEEVLLEKKLDSYFGDTFLPEKIILKYFEEFIIFINIHSKKIFTINTKNYDINSTHDDRFAYASDILYLNGQIHIALTRLCSIIILDDKLNLIKEITSADLAYPLKLVHPQDSDKIFIVQAIQVPYLAQICCYNLHYEKTISCIKMKYINYPIGFAAHQSDDNSHTLLCYAKPGSMVVSKISNYY